MVGEYRRRPVDRRFQSHQRELDPGRSREHGPADDCAAGRTAQGRAVYGARRAAPANAANWSSRTARPRRSSNRISPPRCPWSGWGPISLRSLLGRARLRCPAMSVLLSPACSSFDMFRNYEERGRHVRSTRGGAVVKAVASIASNPTPRARAVAHGRRSTRALVLVTAGLLAFGLAVLYSASAIVAVDDGPRQRLLPHAPARRYRRGNHSLRGRRQDGRRTMVQVGVAAHGVSCADAGRGPAVHATRSRPRIHGSRRFLFGASVQPSELAKLAVVVWTAMLVVRKGDALRGLTKGVLPVRCGGRRAGHPGRRRARSLDCYALHATHGDRAVCRRRADRPLPDPRRACRFRCCGTRPNACTTSCCERSRSSIPGRAPAEVGYQLRQSLIAVGSGGLLGVGFGQGRQQYGFLPFPFNDFIASNIGEEWGFVGIDGTGRGLCRVRVARVSHRARRADAVSAALGHRVDGNDAHHGLPAHRRGDRAAPDYRAHRGQHHHQQQAVETLPSVP